MTFVKKNISKVILGLKLKISAIFNFFLIFLIFLVFILDLKLKIQFSLLLIEFYFIKLCIDSNSSSLDINEHAFYIVIFFALFVIFCFICWIFIKYSFVLNYDFVDRRFFYYFFFFSLLPFAISGFTKKEIKPYETKFFARGERVLKKNDPIIRWWTFRKGREFVLYNILIQVLFLMFDHFFLKKRWNIIISVSISKYIALYMLFIWIIFITYALYFFYVYYMLWVRNEKYWKK